MTRVSHLLERKGSSVWLISPDATVVEAAQKMNEHHVGALVVQDDGRTVGIFTERDVLRRIVARRRDPAETTVGEVMSSEVVCCSPNTSADEARGVMRDRRIRHLPVANEHGQLIGLISIGDLNAELQAEQEQTVFLLTEYINGRV